MDYVTAIGLGFAGVEVSCFGDPSIYENIQWQGGEPLPSKETLDAWIEANRNTGADVKITVLAFRNRFTQAEKIAIDLGSIDDPTAPIEQRQISAAIRVMNADLAVATYVDLSRADIQNGVNQLEEFGMIGAGRADQILTAPIQDVERITT